MFQAIGLIKQILDLLTLAVGAFNKWVDEKRKEKINQSIDSSTTTGDQAPIEQAIGDSNAGKPSNEKIDGIKTRPVGDHSDSVH